LIKTVGLPQNNKVIFSSSYEAASSSFKAPGIALILTVLVAKFVNIKLFKPDNKKSMSESLETIRSWI
jgi:hypothetical protein